MKRIRFAAAAAVGAILLGGVTACGASEDPGGPATITILEYQQARVDLLEKLLPQFEEEMKAEGKDIEVELVADILTDGDFTTKVTQQFHAGTAPDVVDTGGSQLTGWAAAGYLLELDGYLEDWDDWEDFYDVSRERAQETDGHVYSVPHEGSVQSLFYRADVLTDLGIETSQPATWDELVKRLEQVTEQTGEPSIVLPAGTAWGQGTWTEGFLPIVAGTGDTLFDPASATWHLEGDGLDASFELFSELTEKGLLPVEDLLNPNPWEPTKYVSFAEGTLPVAAQGTWGWRYDWGPEGSAPIANVEEKVGTWNYPALVDGTEPYSIAGGGFSFGVNAESEHPDAAVELAKWLSSGEAIATQLAAIGAASPRAGIADIEPYASEPVLLDAEEKLQSSIVPPTGEGSDQIAQAVQNATGGILLGEAGGSEAAEAFADEAEEFLGPDLIAE